MYSKDDDFISGTDSSAGVKRLVGKKGGRNDGDWAHKLGLGAGSWSSTTQNKNPIENTNFELGSFDLEEAKSTLNPEQLSNLLVELKVEMENAAKQLDFERAARLRDRIFHLEQLL